MSTPKWYILIPLHTWWALLTQSKMPMAVKDIKAPMQTPFANLLCSFIVLSFMPCNKGIVHESIKVFCHTIVSYGVVVLCHYVVLIVYNDKNVKVCDQDTLQNHICNYDKGLRLCLAIKFCRMLQRLLFRLNLLSTCLELCIVTHVYGNENRYIKSLKVLETSYLLWNNI